MSSFLPGWLRPFLGMCGPFPSNAVWRAGRLDFGAQTQEGLSLYGCHGKIEGRWQAMPSPLPTAAFYSWSQSDEPSS